jgi:hypothetical protein
MTFELTRLGWPNTAAIVALALLPMVVLADISSGARSDAAAFCPASGQHVAILANAMPPLD